MDDVSPAHTGTSAPIDRTHLLAFDLETTGPDPRTALVVTSAVVAIDGAEVSTSQWLANPGVEIPAGATAVHGITTEQAREHGQPHDQVVAETISAIRQGWASGRALVVFNAAYDLTILRRLDASFVIDGPVVDPYVIDRALDPYRKGKRTLSALCEHYGVRLDNAHDANADAISAARLAWKLLAERPELAETDGFELNTRQAQWHAERQQDFARYLERTGKDASGVNTGWPFADL